MARAFPGLKKKTAEKDLCQQLVADINIPARRPAYPELPMLQSTLKETHERVQRLLSTSR
jgi:hypothetical protein